MRKDLLVSRSFSKNEEERSFHSQKCTVSLCINVLLCVCVCVVGCEHKVFLFDIIQAESQYAHVNEPENVIKNTYILETAIQNFM